MLSIVVFDMRVPTMLQLTLMSWRELQAVQASTVHCPGSLHHDAVDARSQSQQAPLQLASTCLGILRNPIRCSPIVDTLSLNTYPRPSSRLKSSTASPRDEPSRSPACGQSHRPPSGTPRDTNAPISIRPNTRAVLFHHQYPPFPTPYPPGTMVLPCDSCPPS